VPGELHPFLVHFAVGLIVAAPAFDAAGLLLHREALLHAGRWNTLAAAVTTIAAVLTGIGAQASLGAHSPAGAALLHLHAGLGWVLLVAWTPVAVWRGVSRLPLPFRLRTVYLALAFAGAAICLVETGLGAALVYRHGVGLSPAARAEPIQRPPTLDAPR
jgi:uncharacterized membrane protein